MNKKETDELRKLINNCKLQLCTILPHLKENKPVLNRKYNEILIEKAILRDKLIRKEAPFFVKLVQKIKRPAKKERICDYFKTI